MNQWIITLPHKWISTYDPDGQCLRISRIEDLPLATSPPVCILLTVVVFLNGNWSVHACGKELFPTNCKVLEHTPTLLTPSDLAPLVMSLDAVFTCPGNNDYIFCSLAKSHKGVFRDSSAKTIKAKLDSFPFLLHNNTTETLRCVTCKALVQLGKQRCTQCSVYRPTLLFLSNKAKLK